MKLIDKTLSDFAEVLSSDAPAPGGGSVAAYNGALGISLTHMVCALSIGRKKYAEYEELLHDVMEEALRIRDELLTLVDRDTEAYNCVTKVFQMPKETEDEKAKRASAMQEALKSCTLVPLDTMIFTHKALLLTQKIAGKSNENTASDLAVAKLNLKAAVQGAWYNVQINLDGIKDQEFVKDCQDKGEKILAESLNL
jgi:formiminotetrahydrofolate cyclodeaminase